MVSRSSHSCQSTLSRGPQHAWACPRSPPVHMLGEMDLYLARPYNVVRKMVDDACAGLGVSPQRGRRDRILRAR